MSSSLALLVVIDFVVAAVDADSFLRFIIVVVFVVVDFVVCCRHELLFAERSSSSMSIPRDGVALPVCPSAGLARPVGRVLVGRARNPPQMGPGPPAARNAHILTWDMKGNRHFFDPLKTSGFWRLRLGAVRRVCRVVEIAIFL